MSIKDILVSYNGTAAADSALKLALKMAKKYDAHLTGVLAHGPSATAVALGPWVTPELMNTISENEAKRRGEIRDKFDATVKDAAHPEKVHFIDIDGDPDVSLMEVARFYDIVVVGQYDSERETRHLTPHPDVVALQSGKPVLMVPNGYDSPALVERALVAWDGRRAAARALTDSMAILESKTVVTILTVGDSPAAARHDGRDVVAHLARHGVMTDWTPVSREGSIAATILKACEEKRSGLLVMGAYEHSKFAEDIVGGVTNRILRNTKIPVLLAH